MIEARRTYRMQKRSWSLMFLFSVFIAFSCNKPTAPDCFQRAGEPAAEMRVLHSPITQLTLWDHIELRLANPTAESPEILVEAPENLLPEIITEQNESGELMIRNDNTCNFVRRYDHLIRVTIYGQIPVIINRGTGNISSLNALQTPEFLLENRDASGIINLHFENADKVNIQDHTGVAEVFLSGQTEQVELFNQGWGILDASALESEVALTNNNSINRLRVRSSGYVYAAINNSGNTEVLGAPQTLQIVDDGEGEVVEIE